MIRGEESHAGNREKGRKRRIYQFGFSEMGRDMQRRICTKEAAGLENIFWGVMTDMETR